MNHLPKPRAMHPYLEIGSLWRDNDPRCPHRVVEVLHIYPNGQVRIRHAGRETTTKYHRFGKRGRAGFTLVSPASERDNGHHD